VYSTKWTRGFYYHLDNEIPEKSRTALEIWGVTRVLKNGEFWLKMRNSHLKTRNLRASWKSEFLKKNGKNTDNPLNTLKNCIQTLEKFMTWVNENSEKNR